MIAPSEFLQRDERFLVRHLGERICAPETNVLGDVIEIFTENTMQLGPVVMRERLRGLPSHSGMFLPVSNGPLQRRDRGFAVH